MASFRELLSEEDAGTYVRHDIDEQLDAVWFA